MFNYTYDKDGVYIANLANKGEKYGLNQYRLPHNFELAKRSFTITDGREEHVIVFEAHDILNNPIIHFCCLDSRINVSFLRARKMNVPLLCIRLRK